MFINQILKLKFPNASFLKDILLQDDGQGPYIKYWNLEHPLPTQKDLDQWALDFDLQYRQQQAVSQRVYPSIGDQLDMQFKDALNGTTTWIDTIEAVKAAHPKPQE